MTSIQEDVESIVRGFISDMCEWEKQSWSVSRLIRKNQAPPDYERLRALAEDRVVAIFEKYCSPAAYDGQDPRYHPCGRPTEYDPERETIVATVIGSENEAQVVTNREAILGGGRYLYKLVRTASGWKIDRLEFQYEKKWERHYL